MKDAVHHLHVISIWQNIVGTKKEKRKYCRYMVNSLRVYPVKYSLISLDGYYRYGLS